MENLSGPTGMSKYSDKMYTDLGKADDKLQAATMYIIKILKKIK